VTASPPPARPLRRRLRRWLRPPRVLRPTRAGWSFFAITACVAFAALNTGNNLLYLVLSLMLAFMVLSGVLSESALRGIAVRRIDPGELFAATEGSVGLEIRNTQRRVPALAIVVEDCLDHGDERRLEKAELAGRCFALKIAAGAAEHRRYRLVPEQRGMMKLAGIRVSTRFPFALFSKSRMYEIPGELLVYPTLDPALRPSQRSRRCEDGELGAPRPREGAEVSGLREYQDGDSLRRVHWRSSLRRGELLVREAEDSEQRQVEVQLRTAGEEPGAGFEQRVCEAASEVVRQLERGALVGLATDAERIAPGAGERQRTRLLSFLARVTPGQPRAGAAAPGLEDAA
jgi:uncharacterized protein (DUF58 family)